MGRCAAARARNARTAVAGSGRWHVLELIVLGRSAHEREVQPAHRAAPRQRARRRSRPRPCRRGRGTPRTRRRSTKPISVGARTFERPAAVGRPDDREEEDERAAADEEAGERDRPPGRPRQRRQERGGQRPGRATWRVRVPPGSGRRRGSGELVESRRAPGEPARSRARTRRSHRLAGSPGQPRSGRSRRRSGPATSAGRSVPGVAAGVGARAGRRPRRRGRASAPGCRRPRAAG